MKIIAPAHHPSPLEGEEIRPLTREEFEDVRRLIRDSIGLDLKPGKEALVSARLGKRLRAHGLRTVRALVEAAQHDPSGERRAELIDDLTTNFTSFWREPAHFEFLMKTVAPGWRSRTGVQVWSAACSSGEEPYTLMCALQEVLGESFPGVRILATDISRKALGTAQAGVYVRERLEGLPPGWMQKYFQQGTGRWVGSCRVKPSLRSGIEFRRLNLMEPFDGLGPFTTIFCRNVLIYFDRATQSALVDRLAARLEPGGFLFLGHSEGMAGMMSGVSGALVSIAPSVWRKSGAAVREGQEWKP